jgi:hypothetical protein
MDPTPERFGAKVMRNEKRETRGEKRRARIDGLVARKVDLLTSCSDGFS